MSVSKQRIELVWIGRENRPRLEQRSLMEDPERSHHAAQRVKYGREEAKKEQKRNSDFASSVPSRGDEIGDLFENRIIFGNNLLALKTLEQEFAGKIKSIYIDPPYNTGYAFVQGSVAYANSRRVARVMHP